MKHSILRFVYSVQMPKRTATIDPALRKLIVELHLKNNSYGKIAETLGKSKSTIQSVIKRWKESGSRVARHQSGRPISVTKRDENRLTRILKANTGATTKKIFELYNAPYFKGTHYVSGTPLFYYCAHNASGLRGLK